MNLPNSVACSIQGQKFSGCSMEPSLTQPQERFRGLCSSSSKPGRSGWVSTISGVVLASHSAGTMARSKNDLIPTGSERLTETGHFYLAKSGYSDHTQSPLIAGYVNH